DVVDSMEVVNFTLPITAEAGNDTTLCAPGLPIDLTGSVSMPTGGFWSGGAGTYTPGIDSMNISYMPTAGEISAGSVLLYLTTNSNSSCPGVTDSILITINQFSGSPVLSSLNIPCQGNHNRVTITGGNPPFTISWNTTPVFIGDTIDNIPVGAYTVDIIDVNGCSGSLSFSVTEPPKLTVIDSVFKTESLCYDDQAATIWASPSGGVTPYSYQWSDINATTTFNVTGLDTGLYRVTVTDNFGCSVLDSVVVTEPTELLIDSAININPLCIGASDGSAMVYASGGIPNYSYLWNNAETNDTIQNIYEGTYSVTVTDVNNCSKTVEVVLIDPPDITLVNAKFSFSPDEGQTPLEVSFTNQSSSGVESYIWDFGDGSPLDTNKNVTHTFSADILTIYDVTLTANGPDSTCSDKQNGFVTVIVKSAVAPPNIFTPNKDGVNDEFKVNWVRISYLKVMIFNRWGEKLYQWEGVEGGWDGHTLAGEVVPDGIYYYIIDAYGYDGVKHYMTGWVALIR
ncbi:MAG: gliding motility-associated C-terminal domain-containing protein, partial [Bacteroidetes bacterium]|nr:gliding motility-associated C-terminal domain-containing protein [Bacteroidota bacterium]